MSAEPLEGGGLAAGGTTVLAPGVRGGHARSRMRRILKGAVEELWRLSLEAAVKEQGLRGLMGRLEAVAPDLSAIRTGYRVASPFLVTCHRALDAFQVWLVRQVLDEFSELTVVDVGDSSGRHLLYVKDLRGGAPTRCISVNVDPAAVERVADLGIDGVCERAERIPERLGRDVDLFLCFELLEHLTDPVLFLRALSYGSDARYLVATVPYVRRSRVGLSYIRDRWSEPATAENTHVFELSPDDWRAIVRHGGWAVARERIYYQYPRWSPLRATRWLWRRYNFEGYLGLVLRRDHSYSDRYQSWPPA
jgi:SAM-dependent methyltransferase